MAREKNIARRSATINSDSEDRLNHGNAHGIFLAGLRAAENQALARAPNPIAISLTGGAYTQNFDSLASTGTSSTTPTDWFFSESDSGANATYSAGTGSSTTGDTYSFGASSSTERAFGGLQSGSLVPTIGASFTNNASGMITSLLIAYIGEQWRLGDTSGRVDRLDFQISFDATSLTTGTWMDINQLDFASPVSIGAAGARDGNLAANRTGISFNITSLAIANGATFWIRWLDFNAMGSDDGLAIDNFSLTPTVAPAGTLSLGDDVQRAEGDSGTTVFTLIVTRSGGSAGAVGASWTLNFASGGTNAADFAGPTSGTVSFANGVTTAQIQIAVQGDTILEADDIFEIVLSAPTGGTTIGDNQAFGVILNDDSPPNLPATVDLNGTATGSNYAATYTENSDGVLIADASAMVFDDRDLIQDARLVVTDGKPGDQLFMMSPTFPPGITATWTASLFLLELHAAGGPVSAAVMAQAIAAIGFRHFGDDPDDGGIDTQRTIEVTVRDDFSYGPPATSTITIDSVNTPASIGGAVSGEATEDGPSTTGGQLTISDPDGPDRFVTIAAGTGSGGLGSFNLSETGLWSYAVNNALIQHLGAGDSATDTIQAVAADGTMQLLTVTIHGVDDPATFGGTNSGSVTEDGGQTASGALMVNDVDTGESSFQVQDAVGTSYGSFSIDLSGDWSYTLNNSNAAVQALNDGQTLTDTVPVRSFDGTAHNVVITIHGANEPLVTPPTVDLNSTQPGFDSSNLYTEGSSAAIGSFINVTRGTLPIARATITLTDALPGDSLVLLAGLASTITSLSSTGTTIVLTGVGASEEEWEAALSLIRYVSASDNPDNYGTDVERMITVVLRDAGLNDSNIAAAAILIDPTNDSPVLGGLDGDSVTFTEGDPHVVLDNTAPIASVLDPDNLNFAGGFIQVGVQVNPKAEDEFFVLDIFPGVGTVGNLVYVGGLHIGTIATGGPGAILRINLNADATAARVATLLDYIAYRNVAGDNPTAGSRSVSWLLNDGQGGAGTALSTVTIAAVNDAPQGSNGTLTTLEDTNLVLDDPSDFGFSDADRHSFGGVWIDSYSGSGTFLLGGSPLVAPTFVTAAQIAAGDLVFVPAANASGGGYAQFSFRVADNSSSNNIDTSANTRSITVTAVDDAPIVADSTISIDEDQVWVLAPPDFDIAEVDGDAIVSITITGVAGGTLYYDADGAGSGDPEPIGTLPRTFTFGEIAEGLLSWVPEADLNRNAGPSYFQYAVTDAQGTSSQGARVYFDIEPVTDPPTVDLNGADEDGTYFEAAYTEDGPTAPIADTDASVTSDSGMLTGATITITDAIAGDLLSVEGSLPGLIAALYDPDTVTLTLSGQGTVAQYQAALAQIRYSSSSQDPSSGGSDAQRTIEIIVTDGVADGAPASDPVYAYVAVSGVVDNPQIGNLDGDLAAFTEGDAYVLLDAGDAATLADLDSADFSGGKLILSFDGTGLSEDRFDVMSIGPVRLTPGSVLIDEISIGSWDGGGPGDTFTVDFNGDATPTRIQALLRALVYRNGAGDTPTEGVRNVLIMLTDGDGGSVSASSKVKVVAVNDAPMLDLNGAGDGTGSTGSHTENGGNTLFASAATVTDADSADFAGGQLTATVTGNGDNFDRLFIVNQGTGPGQVGADSGIVTYHGIAVGTYAGGFGAADPLVVAFNAAATAETVQAVARRIAYVTGSESPSTLARTVQIVLTDGDGGAGAPATAVIDVIAVNDAPSGNDRTITIAEDTPRSINAAEFSFTDAEGHALLSVTIDSLPLLGTLFYDPDGAGGSTPASAVVAGTTYLASQLTAGRLFYVPAANGAGSNYASFTYTVRDDGGTADNGQDMDASPARITFNVTNFNDAPDLAGLDADEAAYGEGDGPGVAWLDVGRDALVSDVDSADFAGGSLTVAIIVNKAAGEDLLAFSTDGNVVTMIGSEVFVDNISVGTISAEGVGLDRIITFSAGATAALVSRLVQNFSYVNTNQATPSGALRLIEARLADGDGGTLVAHTTVVVTPVNDLPEIAGFGGDDVTFVEGSAAIRVDMGGDALVNDVDSTDFAGGYLQVLLQDAVPSEDVVGFATGAETGVTLSDGTNNGSIVSIEGTAIGAIVAGSPAPNAFTINFNANADAADVTALLRAITYANVSDSPSLLARTLAVTVSDGDGGASSALVTINVTALDDAAVAQPDAFTITESGAIVGGDLFANDTDPDGPPLSISAVNGSAGNVNTTIALASGASLTVNSNGMFNYSPNSAFLPTPTAGSGASNTPGHDSFTYTLAGGNTATVSITLTGLDTDDILRGTAGADILMGGTGNDWYFIENGTDQVLESVGEGNDRVFASVSYTLTAGAEVDLMTTDWHIGTDAINLTGNELANIIFGNDGDNQLNGGAGADALVGRAGDDWFFVDNAGDQVVEAAGEGNDHVSASVSYTLAAGSEVELLTTDLDTGTAAIDLNGNAFVNTIRGNDGDNKLNGGSGADTLVGRAGNDWYFVDNAGDQVGEAAGEGNDRLFAGASYTLTAGAEVELMTTDYHAGTVAIDLTGNELANIIFGNAGSNVIDGKGGNDGLVGNGGADTFAFTTALGAGNVDYVFDFTAGNDKIALDDAVFTGLGLGSLPASAFVTGTAAGDADDRIVYNQATGELFYDADGSGAGAAIQFATLSPGLSLTASDFQVI